MPNESNNNSTNKDTKAKPAPTTVAKPKEPYVSTSTNYVTRVNKQSNGAGRHVGGFGGSTPGGRGA